MLNIVTITVLHQPDFFLIRFLLNSAKDFLQECTEKSKQQKVFTVNNQHIWLRTKTNKIELNISKIRLKQHNLYKIAIDNNRNFLHQEKLIKVHQMAYFLIF